MAFCEIKGVLMSKPLLFYSINERTDVYDYCKRKGLKPYKFENKVLDGYLFKDVIQYVKGDFVYEFLDDNEYYFGMTILMRLPQLTYERLLNVALNSRYYDERVGAISIILKDYTKEFEQFLISMLNVEKKEIRYKRGLKRVSKFICWLMREYYKSKLENIRDICEKLKVKLK